MPKDRKQTFIFCEKCSKSTGTYNYVVCEKHADEYEDVEAMKAQEEKLQNETKKTDIDSRKENLPYMLLFMTLDRDDDGYIQL